MSILVCGSVAFDNIMIFDGRFKNHILPDQLHIINVAFLAPKMQIQYGGCAANIAYNLSLLDCEAYAMATVGKDFSKYADWMDIKGLSRKYISIVEDSYTPRAFIITDMDDNQITAFHPGAMEQSHINRVPTDGSIRLGILSPDGRDGMLQHAAQFKEASIPFMFDPGQGIPMFTKEELDYFIEQADWLACNDYEAQMICKHSGKTLQQLIDSVHACIVTKGSAGSTIYAGNQSYPIAAVEATNIQDPTGCGDAYRAGLLYGIARALDWQTTGRIAALLGAYKIACAGGQNHRFTKEAFAQRYADTFGQPLPFSLYRQ